VRPPALLGEPQHVPTLPAAEADRVPGRELPGNGREGGVDLPGPDPRGVGVPLLPVIGGGHVRVAALVAAVIVMLAHGPSLADAAAVRKRTCRDGTGRRRAVPGAPLR